MRFHTTCRGLAAVLALCAAMPLPVAAETRSGRVVTAMQDYRIYGPNCRFASCWAMVADAEGRGTFVRGRGIIGTRARAEAVLKALTDEKAAAPAAPSEPSAVCFGTGIEL